MTYKELSERIDSPTLQRDLEYIKNTLDVPGGYTIEQLELMREYVEQGEKLEWIEERIRSASTMMASPLMQAYRGSLKFENNPLTEIFEKEILHRLWGYENSKHMISRIDSLCSEEMAECGSCLKC